MAWEGTGSVMTSAYAVIASTLMPWKDTGSVMTQSCHPERGSGATESKSLS